MGPTSWVSAQGLVGLVGSKEIPAPGRIDTHRGGPGYIDHLKTHSSHTPRRRDLHERVELQWPYPRLRHLYTGLAVLC